MIKILVDSSSDYGMQEIKEKGFEFVPISITIGEKNYMDGLDFEKDEFYKILRESDTFPKTSQPSPDSFLSFFREAKEKGYPSVLFLKRNLSECHAGQKHCRIR